MAQFMVSDGTTTTGREASSFTDVGVQVEADVGGSLVLYVVDEDGETRWVWWTADDDGIYVERLAPRAILARWNAQKA